MHAADIRGVRFNLVKRLVPTFRSSCSIVSYPLSRTSESHGLLTNLLILVPLCRSEVPDRTRRWWCRDFRSAVLADFTPTDELMEIAGRISRLGWHVLIYFEAVDLPEPMDFFTALPTTRSSITWAGRTSPSPWTEKNSLRSSRSRDATSTCGRRSVVRNGCRFEARVRSMANRTLTATSCPLLDVWSRHSRNVCAGAPAGRIPTRRTTCSTTAFGPNSSRTPRSSQRRNTHFPKFVPQPSTHPSRISESHGH
jgi:hypothetical protein